MKAKDISSKSELVGCLVVNDTHPIDQPDSKQLAADPDSSASGLIALAVNKNLDKENLLVLMQMKREEEERTARSQFNTAMARVQSRIQPIVANADNEQTGSRYAKLDAIVKSLAPIYAPEGFSVSTGTDECKNQKLADAGWIRVTGELAHAGGYSKYYHVDLPPDSTGIKGSVNKTGIHAAKSTISYGRNILMGLMFNFTTTDDVDNDGNHDPSVKITIEQAAALRVRLKELEADEAYFCDWLKKGTSKLEDLPATLFSQADSAIASQEATKKPALDDATLKDYIDSYADTISSGDSTPAELVAMLSTKFNLTDGQKTKIMGEKQ